MKQIIAYVRVSTRKQGTSGLGLAAQRDANARFAGAEHCDVVDTFAKVETAPSQFNWRVHSLIAPHALDLSITVRNNSE
jgi:DNA invertase Pin-like site-specific DNA recombinase